MSVSFNQNKTKVHTPVLGCQTQLYSEFRRDIYNHIFIFIYVTLANMTVQAYENVS